MAVDNYSIEQWLNCGRRIATDARLYGKLTDMNGDNQGDFDYIFFFADQSRPDVVNICTANRQLKKRNAKGVSDRDLKSILGEFISYSDILFKDSSTAAQVREWLIVNHRKPDYVEIYNKREKTRPREETREKAYKPPFWQRANRWISDIGDTMESIIDVGFGVVNVVVMVALIIAGVVLVISQWISEGFWAALLTAIIAGIIGVIAFYASIVVLYLARIVLFLPRYFFYNAYTFFGVLFVWLLCIIPSIIR